MLRSLDLVEAFLEDVGLAVLVVLLLDCILPKADIRVTLEVLREGAEDWVEANWGVANSVSPWSVEELMIEGSSGIVGCRSVLELDALGASR